MFLTLPPSAICCTTSIGDVPKNGINTKLLIPKVRNIKCRCVHANYLFSSTNWWIKLAANCIAAQDGDSLKYTTNHDASGNTHVSDLSDLTVVDVTSTSEISLKGCSE